MAILLLWLSSSFAMPFWYFPRVLARSPTVKEWGW